MAIFGVTKDGQTVNKYTLKAAGLTAEILDYGAIIRALYVTGRDGKVVNIVLGYDSVEEYQTNSGYLGAVIGRNAGRIAHSTFRLNGKIYNVTANDGANSLHGGVTGFDKAVFKTAELNSSSVTLEHFSPDGDQGYPAALTLRVKYTLTEDGLTVEYNAVADAPTCANFTNHTYFNLDGKGKAEKSIYDTYIKINAAEYLYADFGLVPTGERKSVINTPYDLRVLKKIGEVIDSEYDDLISAGGYDNYFLFSQNGFTAPAVSVLSRQSAIEVNVFTDAPGIQFYSGNFLGGTHPYAYRGAFCLETQYPPNSPNLPEFSGLVLVEPGKDYSSKTFYQIIAK